MVLRHGFALAFWSAAIPSPLFARWYGYQQLKNLSGCISPSPKAASYRRTPKRKRSSFPYTKKDSPWRVLCDTAFKKFRRD